jgi:hypothetical protein
LVPAAIVVLLLAVVVSGCGGSPKPPESVDDLGSRTRSLPLPEWFPAQYPPPEGGVVVEVIVEPTPGDVTIGRTVTWRVDRPYAQVVADVDATLARIGWTPTDRKATEGDKDARRTSIYIENGIVEVIRVYVDAALEGTRVTVELPV